MDKRRSQQVQNQPSTLLNSDENATLFDLIGRRCVTLASAVVQVFFAEGPSYNHWAKRFCGVATFIRDSSKRSYFIRVYDLKRNSPLCEQEIYKAFDYKIQRPYFHSFDGENCPVGLNFANESEATQFQDAVFNVLARKKKKRNAPGAESVRRAAPPSPSNHSSMHSPSFHSPATSPAINPFTAPQLPFVPAAKTSVNGGGTLDRQTAKGKGSKKGKKVKLTAADIGTPLDFQHVQHLGWNHESSGTLDTILEQNPEVKTLFHQVGLSDAELKDKNLETFLMQFLDRHGGVDAVKRDVQTRPAPRPPQVPAPAPPSQHSMGFQAPPMKLPPAPRINAPAPPHATSTSSRSSILDRSAMFEQPVAAPPVPAPIVRPSGLAPSRSFEQGGPAFARGQAPPVPPSMSVRGPRPPVPPPMSSREPARVPSFSNGSERTPPALPTNRAMSQRVGTSRSSAEPPPVPPTMGHRNDSPSPLLGFPGKSQRASASEQATSRAPPPTPIPELQVSPGGRKYGAPSPAREPAAPPPPLPPTVPPSSRAPPPPVSAPPVPPQSRGRYQQPLPDPEPELEEPEPYNDQQGWSRNGSYDNEDYPQDDGETNSGFAAAAVPPPPGPPPPPPPGPPPPPMLGPPPGGPSLTSGLDLQSVQLRQCPKDTEQPSSGRNAHLAAIAKGIQLKPVSSDDRASAAVDDGDVGLASVLKRALDDRFLALAGGDDDDDDEPSDDEEWEDD